jgi:hypothetical protein
MSIFTARLIMAVQFDPRSNSSQGTNTQVSPNNTPAPNGIAGAPSEIVSQASESFCCCGWISQICEWIKSWFSSAPPAAPVFTLEQRIEKGKQLIDAVFSFIPTFNPRNTMMVYAIRYNNELEVDNSMMSTDVDRFIVDCYRQFEDLLRRNEQVGRDTLMVKACFWEKNPDGTFNLVERSRELNFAEEQGTARRAASMRDNVPQNDIIREIEQIYSPNLHNASDLISTVRNL